MDNSTMTSQPSAVRPFAPCVATVPTTAAARVTVAPTAQAVATHAHNPNMAWLGGIDESVCFSGTYVSKRISTGRLERTLT